MKGLEVKCNSCLIWQRKKVELERQDLDLLPALAHFLHKSEIGGIADSAYAVIRAVKVKWKQLILLMDAECPPSRCIFLEENYLK